MDKMAALLESQEMEKRHLLSRSLNEYRINFQYPESRREYDINNPNKLKLEKPLRTGSDEYFPVSGCQKFNGEDPNAKINKKLDQIQLQCWLNDQKAEKEMQKHTNFEWENSYDSKLRDFNHQVQQLQNRELVFKKDIASDIMHTNRIMANDEKTRENESRLQDETLKQMDIHATYHSDLLSENPVQARSSFGLHRVIPHRWKGMSREQVEAIRQMQIQQIEEKKRAKDLDVEVNKEWESYQKQLVSLQQLKQDEIDKLNDAKQRDIHHNNVLLSIQQKNDQVKLQRKYRNNIPNESFFSQFNTSSR